MMLKVSILLGATNALTKVAMETIAAGYSQEEKLLMRLNRERMLEHKAFMSLAVLNVITKPLAVTALCATAVLWVVGK
jgi:hypothetical protein